MISAQRPSTARYRTGTAINTPTAVPGALWFPGLTNKYRGVPRYLPPIAGASARAREENHPQWEIPRYCAVPRAASWRAPRGVNLATQGVAVGEVAPVGPRQGRTRPQAALWRRGGGRGTEASRDGAMRLSRQQKVILAILANVHRTVRYFQMHLYEPVFGSSRKTASARASLSRSVARLSRQGLVIRLEECRLQITEEGRVAAEGLPFELGWVPGADWGFWMTARSPSIRETHERLTNEELCSQDDELSAVPNG